MTPHEPSVNLQCIAVRVASANAIFSAANYFFNREMIIPGDDAKMWKWQKHLYGFLSRNARPAKDYYQIAPSQIIEIGLPVHL